MKKCYKCNTEKDEFLFHKNKSKSDGLASECKDCRRGSSKKRKQSKEYQKEYYKKNKDKLKRRATDYAKENKEKVAKYQKKYRADNKEKIEENRKVWLHENRDKVREYFRNRNKKRKKEDPLFLLAYQIRKRTSTAFKRASWKKDSSNKDMLGCSFEEAKTHIESLFTDGMSWKNHGLRGWHIDHTIPLSSAKTKEDMVKLCHYTNLQPLWWWDNLSKGSKHE